jgi:hypothetical protein
MFQVLGTIFFSTAILAATGVIVTMLVDNAGDVRRALGLAPTPFVPVPRPRVRQLARAAATPRTRAPSSRRAAA